MVILGTQRAAQGDYELEPNLGYVGRFCLKITMTMMLKRAGMQLSGRALV